MAIKFNIPPSHPSKILRHLFFPEGMSVTEIAERLGVSRQSVDALLNERRGLSPEMAQRIALTFGGTVRLLLNLQASYDAHRIEERREELARGVKPYTWPEEPDWPDADGEGWTAAAE